MANLDPTGWGAAQRDARLAALLDAARDGSPLYRRRMGKAQRLQELEPVTKGELMRGFDDWATDRCITLQGASAFLADTDKVADGWLGRYLLWTSSGTSGTPAIFVQDAASLAAYDAIDSLRLRGGAPGTSMWGLGRSFAYVGAVGGHFAGLASVQRLRRLAVPPLAPRLQVFSVGMPLADLAAGLQTMSPQVLVTYPSCAVALASLQAAGELQLGLDEIWLGGEQLSATQRQTVVAAFGCQVRNNYGASECYSMACECAQGRLHLNSDWVILETLDSRGNPVAPGEDAHTVALTNLANRTQPLLRYRLTDRVRYCSVACACGSRFPAIEVEGRADDTLSLPAAQDRRVQLLPLALETVLEEEGGLTQFQLVQRSDHALELRLGQGTANPAAAFARAAAALHAFLQRHGVHKVQIVHGHQHPRSDARSGKLRRIIGWTDNRAPPAKPAAARPRATRGT